MSYSCAGPRPNQEDYIIAPSDNSSRIFVLCDGMGGHGHGEVASKTIANAVHKYLTELNSIEYTAENLQDAIDFALKQLSVADVYEDEKAMGTTIVVIAINRMNVLVGHIGDSRCYLFSEDGVKKFRSKDHSMVQEAVDAEILTEEEAWNNPRKNILTRCITSKQENVAIEVDKLKIEDNDRIMLCSDGVTDALKDSQIQSIIIGRSSEDAADIIKTECEISSRDNFSLILITLSQDENNIENQISLPSDNTIEHHNDNSIEVFGKEMETNTNFCPDNEFESKQQIPDKSVRTESSTPENSIMGRIRRINPIWVFIGGVILGCIISGVAVSHFNKPVEAKQLPPKTPTKTDDLPEPEVTSFILRKCSMDLLNAPSDTLLSKRALQKEYELFLKKIHQTAK